MKAAPIAILLVLVGCSKPSATVSEGAGSGQWKTVVELSGAGGADDGTSRDLTVNIPVANSRLRVKEAENPVAVRLQDEADSLVEMRQTLTLPDNPTYYFPKKGVYKITGTSTARWTIVVEVPANK